MTEREAGSPTGGRTASLDALRLVAAAAVILFHAHIYLGLGQGPLDGVMGSLDLAVFVFFSLSGFLVYLPFAQGPVSLRTHYVKRVLRIFPAYLVAVAAAIWLAGCAQGHELQFALILQGLDPATALQVMPVAWSLHVEVVFYLVLPVLTMLMVAIGGPRARRQVLVLCIIGLASLAARIAVTAPDGMSEYVVGRYAPMMLWAFVPGMLVAHALARAPRVATALGQPATAVGGCALIALALCVLPNDHAHLELLRMVMVTTGAALVIPAALRLRLPRSASAMATGGGCLSYPAYLWHSTVMFLLASLGLGGWLALGVEIPVVVALSALSWVVVERPSLRLASRIAGRLAPSPSAPSTVRMTDMPRVLPDTAIP